VSTARWIVTLLLLPVLGCQDNASTPDVDATPVKSPVEVTTVHSQAVTDRIELTARVLPDPARVVHIFSQVAGRLVALYVRPGQEVKKGETIGTIQSSDIAQVRADYDRARIEAARSDRQLDRAKLLVQHEVMAQRDYDDLEAADQAAHSELTRTAQRIAMLGFSPEGSSDNVALRAPISGTVLEIGSASGEMQRSLDNASAIATIADLESIWVVGDVFERDLAAVRNAKSVDITFPAYPGETWHGIISNISDAIDPTSRTLKVRVILANPGHRLKPEMFGTFSIAQRTSQVFVLPATAVVHEGSSTFVFLESDPGKYERRHVSIGPIHDQTVVIIDGLKNEDRVVTTGAALLRAPSGD
jgi:cobalt-zinc-cadmium efflux system membrane fusion protein